MTPGQRRDEELLREIEVTVQRIYPGRSWEQLSPEEQKAVYQAHQSQREYAGSMINTPAPQGKVVGPSRIYVQPIGDSVAHATRQALGGYLLGKANQSEATGRKALADMQTRRDALDRENENQRWREEEKRRRDWLQTILSRGSYQ